MKKLLAVLSISLFLLAGCQESSTLVAPDNDTSVDKEKQEQFAAPEQGDDGSQDNSGEPSFPRI
jgi:predicted small lipoprotein YifL